MRLQGTRGKDTYEKTRLGHRKERLKSGFETMLRDPYPITNKQGEPVTQKHLDRIESVQILLDTHDGKSDKKNWQFF